MPVSFVHPNNTRATDFRYVYSNTTSLQFMGQEAVLTFAVVRNPSNVNDGAEEQVAVGMTASNLKALAYTVNRIIEHFEKSAGAEIPVSGDLVKAADTAIAAAVIVKK